MSESENLDQSVPVRSVESPGRVASIDQARKQTTRKKASGLTAFERQLLLDEVAKISAELCDLQVWAVEITRRVSASASPRADRTA